MGKDELRQEGGKGKGGVIQESSIKRFVWSYACAMNWKTGWFPSLVKLT